IQNTVEVIHKVTKALGSSGKTKAKTLAQDTSSSSKGPSQKLQAKTSAQELQNTSGMSTQKQMTMPRKAIGKQPKASVLKAPHTYTMPTSELSASKANQEDGDLADSEWDSPDTIDAKAAHILKLGGKQAGPESDTEFKNEPEGEDQAGTELKVQPEDGSVMKPDLEAKHDMEAKHDTEAKQQEDEADAQPEPVRLEDGSVTESDTESEEQGRAVAKPDAQPEVYNDMNGVDGGEGSVTESETEPEAQGQLVNRGLPACTILSSMPACPSSMTKKPMRTPSHTPSVNKSGLLPRTPSMSKTVPSTSTPSCYKSVSAARTPGKVSRTPSGVTDISDVVLDVDDQLTSSCSRGGTNEDAPVPLPIWNDWFIPLWHDKCATFLDPFHIPQMIKHVQELYDWCFPEEPPSEKSASAT
ncbi:hypothetical protein EWM64_g9641, partial [Hericium alpestre]